MEKPEFLRMIDRGPSFPAEYFAPHNKSAHYLTCVGGKKYLTREQLIYLNNAGIEIKLVELEVAHD